MKDGFLPVNDFDVDVNLNGRTSKRFQNKEKEEIVTTKQNDASEKGSRPSSGLINRKSADKKEETDDAQQNLASERENRQSGGQAKRKSHDKVSKEDTPNKRPDQR